MEEGIGAGAVVMGDGFVRVDANGLVVVCDGPSVVAPVSVREAPADVTVGVVRIDANGLIVVCDSPSVVIFVSVGVTPVEICIVPGNGGLG